MWEGLWRTVWPSAAVLGLFVALSLADLWRALPGWPHLAGLVLFALAAIYALRRGFKSFSAPGQEDARRRLEQDSGLEHHPLKVLRDNQAIGVNDAHSKALWQAHRQRAFKALSRLRVAAPRPGIAARDPWALRAAIGLFLFIGLMAAGAAAPERLAAAFNPKLGPEYPPAHVEAWITPPDYTGRAPVLLGAAAKQLPAGVKIDSERPAEQVTVPANSVLYAKVNGGKGSPALILDGTAEAFEAIDSLNHQISRTLTADGLLSVAQNEQTLARWRITVQPDEIPVAVFRDAPSKTVRLALKIPYLATDDHGVTALRLKLAYKDNKAEQIELNLAGGNRKTISDTLFHDFTPHRWAGLKVAMTLEADDAAGNTGRSATIDVVLPERKFKHPVARAVIEQRRRLAMDQANRLKVSRALGIIGAFPDEYNDDSVVTLALRAASRRLVLSPPQRAVDDVIKLLWDVALRIEDGKSSIAERDLRRAQQNLMEALARNADEAEIDRLTEELKQAMDRFFRALAQEMARQMQQNPQQNMQPFDPNAKILGTRDLQRMLDRARELSRLGAKDAARELLSQLRDMLESLRTGRQNQRADPRVQEGQRALNELGKIMRRQQELLDRTFRRSREGEAGGKKGKDGQNAQDTAEQEALRRELGEIMRRLGEIRGEIPGNLGKAERAMRRAGKALSQNQPGQAVPSQSEALAQLRSGAEALARQVGRERAAGGIALRPGQRRLPRRPGTDPLGRPLDEAQGSVDGDVKIPGEDLVQRARRILDELRRRAGDMNRPDTELQYIDRLLRRF